MSSLLKIVKESGISFLGSLIGMFLGYAWLVIITRFLTPDEFGIFTLAQAIINISLIFVLFGTPKALDRFIPYYNARGEQGKTKMLIQDILKVTLVLSIIVGIILFLSSGILSNTLFNESALSLMLKIMVLSIPLLTFIRVTSFSFIGFKELRYQVYLQQIALPLLKIILAVVIFALGYGLFGWAWMYILSLGGTVLLAFWFFRKDIVSALSKVTEQSISFKRILSYSWPLSVNSIILIFLGQIDFLFLGAFRSSADVGVYRIYLYLVAILGLVLHSFAQIYKPVVSELVSKDKLEEVKETYKRVSKWIFNINAFGFLVILLFGPDIVTILFTKSYLVAPVALFVLAAGRFVNSSFGPEGMSLEAFGNTKLSMLNALIMLVTNLGLDFLLIPQYGILGAAIATAISVTVGGLAGLIEIYVLHSLQPFKLEHLKCLAVFLSAGFILYVLQFQLAELNVFWLIGLIMLLAGLYIAGLYFTQSLDTVDYQVLTRIKAKLVGRGSN